MSKSFNIEASNSQMRYLMITKSEARIEMITLELIFSIVLCSVYVLIETVRNGMAKKRWVMAGLILGPMILPMFQISKKMALRKAIGYENSYLGA